MKNLGTETSKAKTEASATEYNRCRRELQVLMKNRSSSVDMFTQLQQPQHQAQNFQETRTITNPWIGIEEGKDALVKGTEIVSTES